MEKDISDQLREVDKRHMDGFHTGVKEVLDGMFDTVDDLVDDANDEEEEAKARHQMPLLLPNLHSEWVTAQDDLNEVKGRYAK